jgi:hypothetical protein
MIRYSVYVNQDEEVVIVRSTLKDNNTWSLWERCTQDDVNTLGMLLSESSSLGPFGNDLKTPIR